MNISLIPSLVVFSFWAVSNAGFALSSPFDALILASQSNSNRPAASSHQTAEAAPLSRSDMPIVTVSTTGDGQAGYVHYFVITGPDGEHESQVGIELPDHRIAWSFPELGVLVSPFIASGVDHSRRQGVRCTPPLRYPSFPRPTHYAQTPTGAHSASNALDRPQNPLLR